MSKGTGLHESLQAVEGKERYDAQVKRVLGYKVVLAEILQGCLREYQGMTRDEVEACISGEPEIGVHPVHGDGESAARAKLLANEDSSPAEGIVSYDVRFEALTARGERTAVIINVEAQRSTSPGYPLTKRAMYYCSRLISAQRGEVFSGDDYGKLRKVVSIWICTEPPLREAGSITSYRIVEERHVGKSTRDMIDYDLLEIVMVCLGETQNDTRLLSFLGTLLDEKTSAAKKARALREQFDIADEGVLEGASEMCNLSEGIEERGIEKGLARGRAEGRAEGEGRFARLAGEMISARRIDELRAASRDTSLLPALYAEFGIE